MMPWAHVKLHFLQPEQTLVPLLHFQKTRSNQQLHQQASEEVEGLERRRRRLEAYCRGHP
jgi:hypothetical protein